MPPLPLLVKAFVVLALQFFYLAHSLVVVEYSSRFRQGGSYCQWREKQNSPTQSRRVNSKKAVSYPSILGRRVNGIFFASTAEGEGRSSSTKSLKELLKELTDRGIAFSPLASRSELEQLLAANRRKGNKPSSSTSSNGSEERQKQRLQHRIERRTKNKSPDQILNSFSSSTSRQNRRQRRREEWRKDRNERIREDSLDSDTVERKPRQRNERGNTETARLRKRRRRERLGQKPPSLLDSISDNLMVNEVIGIGSRAGRIARKKTGNLWDGIVDSTYGDDGYDYEFGSSSSQNRRERRRSGFNWQRQSPRRKRRRNKDSYPPTEDRSRASRNDTENPSTSYYYDDENKPPSSESRSEQSLEKQKRQIQRQSRKNREQQHSFSRSKQDESFSAQPPAAPEMTSETQRRKLPIGQIIAALNERNISFSPRASRKELEDLLLDVLGENNVVAVKNAEEDNIQVIEVESISPEDWKRQQEEKLRQKQKEQEREEEQKQMMKKQQQQQEKSSTKTTSEKSNSRQQAQNDKTSTVDNSGNFYRSVNRNYRPSSFSSPTAKAYRSGSSRKQPRSRPKAARAASISSPSSANPSVSESKKPQDEGARRIYSPFGGKRPESAPSTTQGTNSTGQRRRRNDFGDIRDDFDRFGDVVEDDFGRFGNFVANSVDSIFWGKEDEYETSRKTSNNEAEGEAGESSKRRRNSRRKRHWKDRAEERLDKMMGVHNVGDKNYDRWTKRDSMEIDDEEADGYDAISYTRGRRRRNKSRAFWEEDSSVFSVLFGNDPRRSLRDNMDDVFGSSNSLTSLLRNLFVVLVNVLGRLCKWASVRGTIPRPVVFLGGMGAGLVSQPGSRIKNALLAFLSIRVLGEWLSEESKDTYSTKRPKRSAPRVPRNSDQDKANGDE